MFRRIFPWIFSGAHTSTPEVNDFPVTPPKKPPEIPKPEVDLEDSKITAKIQAIKVLAEDIVLFDNDNHDNTIEIDGQQANLKMGGKRPNGDAGKDGDIWLFAKDGDRSNVLSATIHLDADTSGIRLRDSGGNTTIHLDGDASGMSLRDSGSDTTIYLQGEEGNLKMGGKRTNGKDGKDGDILLFAKDGDRSNDLSATIHLDADTSGIRLRDSGGNTTIHLDGDASGIHLRDSSGDTTVYLWGEEGNLKMGGKRANGKKGKDGDILLFAKDGDRSNDLSATIHLDADTSGIRLRDSGGNTTIHLDGDASGIHLRDSSGDTTVYLWGEEGNLKMGGKRANGKKGKDGDILLFAKDGDRSKDADATIHLDGDTGFIRCNGKMEAKDLCCTGADYAEEFGVSATGVVEPGTVMVIDEAGGLRPATEAYDKKVAGIVSGAGNLNPGVILDRQPGKDDRVPVALMGKVYCKVDAQYAPVEVGDLLTTSATPGYAMKATEPTQAYGAILGKALRAIDAERGLIPVLVTLQ